MSDDRFKVVESLRGVQVNAGEQPKGMPFQGLTESAADSDSGEHNARAEALGIETRYEVKPL